MFEMLTLIITNIIEITVTVLESMHLFVIILLKVFKRVKITLIDCNY